MNSLPLSPALWTAQAALVIRHSPYAATDWEEHRAWVRFRLAQDMALPPAPADPPMTAEEEETLF